MTRRATGNNTPADSCLLSARVRRARFVGRVIALGVITGALGALGSCNIAAPVAIALAPPPTQEAEYLLQDRPTAVLVDDRLNALGDRPLRRYIGDKISEHLMVNKVLVKNVPIRTRDVLAVIGQEEHSKLMSIERIGREVGAEQIVYIEVMRFVLETMVQESAEQLRAVAEVRVRVLDVVAETRLYPTFTSETGGEEGRYRTLFIELPSRTAFDPGTTRVQAREAELALADRIADQVAKLFYKHEVKPLGRKIDTSVR